MKREDAFYHKILLMTGLDDSYDEWLNYYLESEDPLSDIVLELACCGSDVNKTISTLHSYCAEQPFDVADVCDRVRMFYHKAYYSYPRAIDTLQVGAIKAGQLLVEINSFGSQRWRPWRCSFR